MLGGIGQAAPQTVAASFWLDASQLTQGAVIPLLELDAPNMAFAVLRCVLRAGTTGYSNGAVTFGFNEDANDATEMAAMPPVARGLTVVGPGNGTRVQGVYEQTLKLRVHTAPTENTGTLVLHLEGAVFDM